MPAKSKSSASPKSSKSPQSKESIESMSVEELRSRVERALALVAEARQLLPGLQCLTDEDRRYSSGRMRDGETQVLGTVLDTVELKPELFTSLGDKDEGHDPDRFETELLRERLERREILADLQQQLQPLADNLADTVLYLGGLARPPLLAAYRIAKTLSQSDKKLRTSLAPAINFYGKITQRAASTRKKNAKPA